MFLQTSRRIGKNLIRRSDLRKTVIKSFFNTDVTKNDGKITAETQEKIEEGSPLSFVQLPDDGHHEVSVLQWYKGVGDEVKVEEALCEIDTPEYSYDLQADVEGFLTQILKRGGSEKLSPGTKIAVIGDVAQAELVVKEMKENSASIEDYLLTLGEKYTSYIQPLKQDGFDTVEELQNATLEDLEELGIKTGHAKLILKKLE
eukprot:snap_masked-scaffold_5-processed-gene-11.23-mRNA-1 protein AED:1.00 eAED:1.00 QI:0/-1/0/0/-1/1/1/0/201